MYDIWEYKIWNHTRLRLDFNFFYSEMSYIEKLFQKTSGWSNWVALQIKVLIVFHSGCSWTVKCVVESIWESGWEVEAAFTFGGQEVAGLGSNQSHPISLVPAAQWAPLPLAEYRKLGQSRRPALRICVAFRKDFPQAAQAYFSGGSTGFAEQWIGCTYGEASNSKYKSFLPQHKEICHHNLFLHQTQDVQAWACQSLALR